MVCYIKTETTKVQLESQKYEKTPLEKLKTQGQHWDFPKSIIDI